MDAVFQTLKMLRRVMLRSVLPILALVLASGHAECAQAQSFDGFLVALRADALAQGITPATFDAAFAGVTPDARVIAAMQRQPEYGKPFGAYVESMVSPSRIAIGIRKSVPWADTLQAVEKKFGVDAK